MKLEDQADIKRRNRKERSNAMKEIVKEREENYVGVPTKGIKVKKTGKKTKPINKKLPLEDEDEKKKFEEGWNKTRDEIKDIYAKKEKLDEARKMREEKKMLKMLDKSEQATSSTDKPNYEVHGTKLVENNNVSFWKKQNMGFIKDQAQLRGVIFTDLEMKGGQKTNHRGVIVKFDKFKKKDYLNALVRQLYKNKEISKDDYNKYLSSNK
jgi:hypothetical protein